MKKMIVLLMIIAVLFTGLTGCAKKPAEESAAVDTAVEGNDPQPSAEGDKPQIVEKPGNTQSGQQTQTPNTPSASGDKDTPNTETPQKEQPDTPSKDNPTQSDTTQDNKPSEEDTTVKQANLTLMTFNVRFTNDPNGHSIKERAPRVKQIIDAHNPDIIGMQEVVPNWDAQLNLLLGDQYGVLTHYRSDTNPEGLSILYKKDAFQLIGEDFFWLSDTPDVESKGWGGSLPRICTWARLKHKATGKTILMMSYHGEGTDVFARNAFDVIYKRLLERYKSDIQFLVGDFNLDPSSVGMASYIGYFDEARTTVSNPTSDPATLTCPGGYPDPAAPAPGTYHFDFIFHQEEKAAAVDYIVDTTRFDGYFASDHYPLITTYQI